MHDADSILVSFLRSTDESERERLLDELILVHSAPLIRQTIWRRLGWYLKPSGGGSNSPDAPDAEDMQNEIAANLIQRLREIQRRGDANPIGNFRQYAVRVAENCCHDHLRAKSRARYHLKDTLRNLLYRRREFKTWKGEGNSIFCGFAAWNGRKPTGRAPNQLEEIVARLRPEIASNPALRRARLAGIVTQVFKLSDQPIELDDLTEIIASLLDVNDPLPESLDQNLLLSQSLPSEEIGVDVRLEESETLREFWNATLRLPGNQRLAFCLNFSNPDGDDLLSMLLNAKVVTPAEFARSLELTEEQMWKLWDAMPMKNAAVAAHLGAKPEEVGKWLYFARKELRNHLSGAGRKK